VAFASTAKVPQGKGDLVIANQRIGFGVEIVKGGGAAILPAGRALRRDTNKYASAHDLRRSFGTRWAKRVMPVVLQKLMRHSPSKPRCVATPTSIPMTSGENMDHRSPIFLNPRLQ